MLKVEPLITPEDVPELVAEESKYFRQTLRAIREARFEKLKEELGIKELPPSTQPIVWQGTLRQLADYISGLFKSHLIKARSRTAAFQLMSAHFVLPDGSGINPRSLQQSLRNRDKEKEDRDSRDSSRTSGRAGAGSTGTS